MRTEGSILKEIRETKDLSEELEKRLDQAIEKFKETFAVQEEAA
jgi:F0F1-type ATP synthase alpha subunit